MTETPDPEDLPDDEPEGPSPNAPANAAKALEKIFTEIRSSGQSRIRDVWTTVLGCAPTTPEFVARHAEVVKLVDELRRYLTSLADNDELRRRHEGDIPKWYEVVVNQGDWASAINANSTLIDESDIRLIAALGDIMAYKAPGQTLDIDGLATLRAALGDCRTLLIDTSIPDDLKIQIREQIAHIEWLLDHADRFGYKPVINESRSLLGHCLKALIYAPAASAAIDCVTKLATVVTHVQGSDYAQAANLMVGAISSFSEILAKGQEQKALPVGKGNKLNPGKEQKAIGARGDDESAQP